MRKLLLLLGVAASPTCWAQSPPAIPTPADTLRSSLTPERAPLHIDSIIFNGHERLDFQQEGNALHVRGRRQKPSGPPWTGYGKVFDQYLRTVQVPEFDYYFSDNGKMVHYRYVNCVHGFNPGRAPRRGQYWENVLHWG